MKLCATTIVIMNRGFNDDFYEPTELTPTVAQPPGTRFLPTSTTLLTPVHSENDSTVYFMIVLTADYCWRSWTCRIAAPYKFHVD